jgi:hypothetical protein
MQRREFLKLTASAAGALGLTAGATAAGPRKERAVAIRVRADRPGGELRPIWRFFGADEPNYAYMKAGPAAAVELTVQGLDTSLGQVRLAHYRIDGEHSNAYTAWQKMGSPKVPSAQQRAALRKSSSLTLWEAPRTAKVRDGQVVLRFTMPRQSVSLLRLGW